MNTTNREEHFDKLFEEFKKENPDWDKRLTDSTYYDFAVWYDEKHGLANPDHYSDEGCTFAGYVWHNYIETRSLNWKQKEIDWEQRRYEIAKELYIARSEHIETTWLKDAKNVVHAADILINELKKYEKN